MLSLRAELGDPAEVGDTEGSELITKPIDPRASRAKRRGGAEVLRGYRYSFYIYIYIYCWLAAGVFLPHLLPVDA